MKSHKIAYHIIAFEDPLRVLQTVQALWTEEDYFIIHWNPMSSKKDYLSLQNEASKYPNVYIYSKFPIRWGGGLILRAQMDAFKILCEKKIDYSHYIALTQQDFPIKSPKYIKKLLAQHIGQSFFQVKEGLDIENGGLVSIFFQQPYMWWRNKVKNPLPLSMGERVSVFYFLIRNLFSSPRQSFAAWKRKIKQIYKEGMALSLITETFSAAFMDEGSGHSIFRPKWVSPYKPQIYYIGGHTVCLSRKHVDFLLFQKKTNRNVQELYKRLVACFAPEETFICTALINDLESEVEKKDIFECFSVVENMQPNEWEVVVDPLKFQIKSTEKAEEVRRVFKTYGHNISIRPVDFRYACFMRKISNPKLIEMITAHLGGKTDEQNKP